jgi:hypothetical protein
MKFKAKSLVLGICLAITLVAANNPAEARSTTGWNSFRVWSPLGADNCVRESFGAAVNKCNSDINLTFEMLVDTASYKYVTVVDFDGGYGTLTCGPVAFSGQSDVFVGAPPLTFNPSGQQALHFQPLPVYSGWGMSLYCWSISPGRGIATINWNPA